MFRNFKGADIVQTFNADEIDFASERYAGMVERAGERLDHLTEREALIVIEHVYDRWAASSPREFVDAEAELGAFVLAARARGL